MLTGIQSGNALPGLVLPDIAHWERHRYRIVIIPFANKILTFSIWLPMEGIFILNFN